MNSGHLCGLPARTSIPSQVDRPDATCMILSTSSEVISLLAVESHALLAAIVASAAIIYVLLEKDTIPDL